MALNITEANAVNRLYDWLTGRDRGGRQVSREAAIESMATLAKSAHHALHAGVSDTEVRAGHDRWPTIKKRTGG
jgi:hypothetical protein